MPVVYLNIVFGKKKRIPWKSFSESESESDTSEYVSELIPTKSNNDKEDKRCMNIQ